MNQSTPDNTQDFRSSPLRVHFVITSLPVGGAEVLLLNMLRRMNRDHVEPEVICMKEPGELGTEIASQVPLHSHLIGSKWDIGVLPRLSSLLRKRESDAVITIGAGDKMFWGRLAAKLAGVPVICSALHSTGWPDGVGKLNRLLTPITDGFIACAQGHAEHLSKYEKFSRERVFMIPNGVDTDRFCPNPKKRGWLRDELAVSADSLLVGIVAALREEKNHVQFVKAGFQVLKEMPNTHFVIVGDGPEKAKIEAEIRSLGLAKHFHLLGSRSDTDSILPGLDAFTLTSRNEANPVSILEALSCGVPVVAPDVGSISETVIPGQTGFLTQPLDEKSTAEMLLKLLANPAFASELGRNGRNLVEQTASLDVMVSGYESLISQLYNNYAGRNNRPLWRGRSSEAATTEGNSAAQSVNAAASVNSAVPLDIATGDCEQTLPLDPSMLPS